MASTPSLTVDETAPVLEHVAPASASAYSSDRMRGTYTCCHLYNTSSRDQFVALALAFAYATATVIDYVTPFLVIEHIAPAPSVTFATPSEQYCPDSTTESVTTVHKSRGVRFGLRHRARDAL